MYQGFRENCRNPGDYSFEPKVSEPARETWSMVSWKCLKRSQFGSECVSGFTKTFNNYLIFSFSVLGYFDQSYFYHKPLK